jgi:hypothetical protein
VEITVFVRDFDTTLHNTPLFVYDYIDPGYGYFDSIEVLALANNGSIPSQEHQPIVAKPATMNRHEKRDSTPRCVSLSNGRLNYQAH